MRSLLAIAIVTSLVTSARAQAPAETQPSTDKDPTDAIVLSTVPTALALGLMVAGAHAGNGASFGIGAIGMFLGPSLGHWYAGEIGGEGLALRTVGAVLIAGAIADAWSYQGDDCLGESDAECSAQQAHQDRAERRDEVIAIGGLAVWTGSAIYDIVTAGSAATRWNRDHHLTLTPTAIPSTHQVAAGVALTGSF